MFEEATDYLEAYRTDKLKALNNEQRAKWFCGSRPSMDAVYACFETAKDNDKWSALYAEPKTRNALLWATRLKVNFVASLRQDMREQYMSADSDTITQADFPRYNYAFLNSVGVTCAKLVKRIVGLTTVSPGASAA